MVALSIRQPWAWLILHAGKEFENREWPTKYRGPLLIHAAKTMSKADYLAARLFISDNIFGEIILPKPEDLERGGIVGRVDLVDCVTASNSAWFCGPYGFKLANPAAIPFLPWKGRLGLFTVQQRCDMCAHWDANESLNADCMTGSPLPKAIGTCVYVSRITRAADGNDCRYFQLSTPGVPMTFTIYARFDEYRWVATCPDAGRDFPMRRPWVSARQACDDIANQLLGRDVYAKPAPKLVRFTPKIYKLILPDIPVK